MLTLSQSRLNRSFRLKLTYLSWLNNSVSMQQQSTSLLLKHILLKDKNWQNPGSGDLMAEKNLHRLNQFLVDYPGMSIAPCRGADFQLRGKFDFIATVAGHPEIKDIYKLKISIPNKFPQALPKVKEIGGKIPRDENHHVNTDGTLCLGSPMRLLRKVYKNPSLTGFAEDCLIPYLYAVSYKIRNGGNFIFGELAHGKEGIIDDYSVLLELGERSRITEAIRLLGLNKRVANKKLCPCGCGKCLGACNFHYKLNEFRKMAPVSWFKAHYRQL